MKRNLATATIEALPDRDDLPEGWTTREVQEIFRSFGGGTPNKGTSAYWGGAIPWLSSGDIKTDRIQSASESITKTGLANSSAHLCRAGSVVVVVRSGILKHTLPVAVLERDAAINQDIKCFDSGDDNLNAWLALALKSSAKVILALNREGTTVQSVKYETLRDFDLPIPPLAEQDRIIRKTNDLQARVEVTAARLARISKILKAFRQSVLAAACSGRLTESWRSDSATVDDADLPTGWQWIPLSDLLPKGGIFDGPFGSNLKTADYTDSGVRVIRMENIGWLSFVSSKQTFIREEKYASLVKHTVGAGDIIVASFVEDAIRTCVLPPLPTKAIAKADCFCIRPKPGVVDRNFLALQLTSRESHDSLHADIHGATRPRVNTTQLKQLPIRICSLPEQKEIVRRVEALFKFASKIEDRVAAATKRADKLMQAVLAKAFRGELVPTEAELARQEGRGYEPASALLARIEAEREM